MSEQEYDTKPTLETLLERLAQMDERLSARLERIETQLDRVASAAYETRADVRELKGQLKEHFPFVK